jgi:hypothetical protein
MDEQGFTDEELDFIITYDIKCRMDQDRGEGEQEARGREKASVGACRITGVDFLCPATDRTNGQRRGHRGVGLD